MRSSKTFFEHPILFSSLRSLCLTVGILHLGIISLSAQVSGTVFKDFNANGAKNNSATFNEVGQQGVVVIATDPAGSLLTVSYTGGGASTNSTGEYSVSGGTLGQIRLEFVLPDDYIFASNGDVGGTTILFPTTATQDLAVNYPGNYCQSTPDVITSRLVNGRAAGAGTETFVKFPYTASGAGGASNTWLANANQIGSTWGIAYNKAQDVIYASALLKRHVSMVDNDGNGTEDIGAIYSLTPSGSPALWLDMSTLTDVGISLMPSIATRNLPLDRISQSHDVAVYDLVGKIGLGDIDISDDSRYLYVMNLYEPVAGFRYAVKI